MLNWFRRTGGRSRRVNFYWFLKNRFVHAGSTSIEQKVLTTLLSFPLMFIERQLQFVHFQKSDFQKLTANLVVTFIQRMFVPCGFLKNIRWPCSPFTFLHYGFYLIWFETWSGEGTKRFELVCDFSASTPICVNFLSLILRAHVLRLPVGGCKKIDCFLSGRHLLINNLYRTRLVSMRRILGLLLLYIQLSLSVKVIKNGLAPPEIVHTPISTKRKSLHFLSVKF